MATPAVRPSTQQLKALTHPVRVRMLGILRTDGPATSTTLAQRLGLNTGATSYHLRQLALHGFVVDDAERGNGRERWWRAAHAATDVAADDDPETLDAFLQAVVLVAAEQLQRAVEERPLLPRAWREASEFSDVVVRLTPARARALVDALLAVVEDVGDPDDADDPEAADFVLRLDAYPVPGKVAGGGADRTS